MYVGARGTQRRSCHATRRPVETVGAVVPICYEVRHESGAELLPLGDTEMKVGIVTFNDGRKRVAQANDKDCKRFQSQIVSWLKREKHSVIDVTRVVWNYDTARRAAAKLQRADVVICPTQPRSAPRVPRNDSRAQFAYSRAAPT